MLAGRTHLVRQAGRGRLWAGLFAFLFAIVQTAETQSPPPSGSLTTVGFAGTGSDYPATSADGRYVAFVSELRLDPADTSDWFDIYLTDRLSNTTVLVSKSDTGFAGNNNSRSPSISADGRFVAFASDASNLIFTDENNVADIFVRDRDSDGNGIFDEPTGTTLTRESVSADGPESNCHSARPSLSGNGRYVAFDSCVTNWPEVQGKTSPVRDVFVRDRTGNTTTWANPPIQISINEFNNHDSGDASLSADGRYVAFESQATTQQPANIDPFLSAQVYVRDTCLHMLDCDPSTEWASRQVAVSGQPSDARKPAISADSRFVAYESRSTSMVPGDTNGVTDIFVFDRQTRAVTRVNVSSLGEQATTTGPSTCAGSLHAALSGDGRFVTFESCANNLVPDDTVPPNFQDVFVHDRDADANGFFDEPGGIATALISRTPAGATAGSSSLYPGISADGRIVVFSSFARDLTPDPFIGSIGVYAWTSGNAPPVADAGPDQRLPATSAGNTQVLLDGAASHDPNGDPLTFTWTGPFGTLTGASISPTLDVGSHTITLTVDDGRGGTASDTVDVIITGAADLSLTASGAPAPVAVGSQITYSLIVTNNGPADATGVVARTTLPASVTFVSASAAQGSCSGPAAGSTGTVTCDLGSIVNGAQTALAIVVTPTADGPLAVLLSVSGGEPDTDSTNNSASVNVTVLGPVVINITETIAVTDTPGVRPSAMLNVTEQIVVQDTPNVLPSAMLAINESVTVTDRVTPLPSALLSVMEQIVVQDTPNVLPSAMLAINEIVTVTDLPTPLPSAMLVINETVTVSDLPRIMPPLILNTGLGANVVVLPMDIGTGNSPVTMTFANVTQAGQTILEIGDAGPPPPPGFVRGTPSLYHDLTTTAAFTGLVQVCVTYAGTSFPAAPLLFHYETDVWVNITALLDAANQVVCGNTLSLSPFALFAPANQPPSLTLPPSLVAEATSAAGASVDYTVTANDPEDGSLTPACDPSSGAAFPFGTTTVSCTATDSVGAESQGSFTVSVRDTIAPRITVPANQSVVQTIAAGAIVNYPAPAIIENGSGLFSSSCQPAAGAVFAVGMTTVTCTAADRSGNTAAATFIVTVLPAPNGRMHGAGHLDRGNERHHFAFRVSQVGRNEEGRLDYRVTGPRQHPSGRFEATSVTAVTFLDDPGFEPKKSGGQGRRPSVDTVSFAGAGKWNGRSGYTFEAITTDQGEPGHHRDTFSLVVRDSRRTIVANVSGPLDGGNIQSTRLGR